MKVNNFQHQTGNFSGAGGVRLFYQSWHPQGLSRATVPIIHGLGVHSDIFDNMIEFLVNRKYAVYAFDLRGHGRSPGQRGYINSWSEFREDLRTFLRLIALVEKDLPIFLLGQSLGGTIALDYALHYSDRLQGIILLAPALQVGVSPWKLTVGRILSRFFPRFALDTGIDITTSSRDPEVLQTLSQDSMRHTRGTARLATEFINTVAWIETHISMLKVSLLILHGGADQITLPESSRLLFERVALADKERREYPESYHELHNDLNCQDVFVDIENWLAKHLKSSTNKYNTSTMGLTG